MTSPQKPCPVCGGRLHAGGGRLHAGEATIPYLLGDDVVVVVKCVPSEICSDCREAFTEGKVTDRILDMIRQLKNLRSEVSVITYSEYEPA